ncbi:hypothetical protein V8B97DRAFT_1919936 [Scleroderma yunnanense]
MNLCEVTSVRQAPRYCTKSSNLVGNPIVALPRRIGQRFTGPLRINVHSLRSLVFVKLTMTVQDHDHAHVLLERVSSGIPGCDNNSETDSRWGVDCSPGSEILDRLLLFTLLSPRLNLRGAVQSRMPLVTTLIDNKSPLISYDSTWIPGSSNGDPYEDQYFLGTFTVNNVSNGKATFTFNGTGSWIYGAQRNNHGAFTVQVDGAIYANNEYSANNQFMRLLDNTGTSGQYVDIDMVGGTSIVWQSEVGNTSDQLTTETVQATDPRFQYSGSGWSANPSNDNFFSDGTAHATFTFTMVTMVGSMGPQNGPFSVRLDEGQSSTYNGTASVPFYGITLFHADNLGAGNHQLTITNLLDTNGQALGIDYALVSSVSSVSSTLSTGTITGIVIGVFVVLTTAVAFFTIENVPVAFASFQGSTAVDSIRNLVSSPSSGHVPPAVSNVGSSEISQFPGFTSNLEARRLARPSNQPQVIAVSRRPQKGQGVEQPLSTDALSTQSRNENSGDRNSRGSLSVSELPPNYAQAMQIMDRGFHRLDPFSNKGNKVTLMLGENGVPEASERFVPLWVPMRLLPQSSILAIQSCQQISWRVSRWRSCLLKRLTESRSCWKSSDSRSRYCFCNVVLETRSVWLMGLNNAVGAVELNFDEMESMGVEAEAAMELKVGVGSIRLEDRP